MKKLKLMIEKDACYDLTDRLFMEMSGINKSGKKFDRMKKDAGQIREQVEDRVDIRIACNFYDDIDLSGRDVNIGGETFTCNAFELLDKSTVNGAYVYALTAGEYDLKEQSIMSRLYADIWGTSFADAARIILKDKLSKADRLSDSFGPGFYGMSLDDMTKIDKLLNFKDIGIELKNSKILVPVKSCAGVFFSVTDKYDMMNRACVDCIGSKQSCILCKQREIAHHV